MSEEQKREQRLVKVALTQNPAKGIDDTDFLEIIQVASAKFKGNLHVLQSAIGSLMVARLYGWRVLKLMLSHRVFKSYQDILGVEFKEVCPERGVLYEKSIGCAVADKAEDAFWKIVQGVAKIDCPRADIN